MIDRLEPRTLLANVVGEIRDNVLYLTGTPEGDHLSLVGGADFDASINGRAGTTVNGSVEDFGLLTTVDGILIELGGGNDSVEIHDGSWWDANVTIIGGNGDDQVSVVPSIYNFLRGDVFFAGGAGNDRLSIVGRQLQGRVDFERGLGHDRLVIERSRIATQLAVFDMNGPTTVRVTDTTVARSTTIATGNSADTLSITTSHLRGQIAITTRAGRDTLSLQSVRTRVSPSINVGNDGDVVLLDRILIDATA